MSDRATPTAEQWESAPYPPRPRGHLPGCDDDGWDHPDECVVEWPTTYDDGEVVGAGLRSELVGDDDLLLTMPTGDEHTLNRVQVAFLKAAVAAYEAHNGGAL